MKQIETGLIAILRHLPVEQAEEIGSALYELGFRILEVPLNSNNALKSIELLKKKLPSDCLLGAGTVLEKSEVKKVYESGGEIIISPNFNPAVIEEAFKLNLIPLPGCFTPTEIFSAISLKVKNLKLFPMGVIGIKGYQDLKAVVPSFINLIPVGGINEDNLASYLKMDCRFVGIGSSLYKPNKPLEEIIKNGKVLMSIFNQYDKS